MVAFDEHSAVILNLLASSYWVDFLCGSCVEPLEASSGRHVASSGFSFSLEQHVSSTVMFFSLPP